MYKIFSCCVLVFMVFIIISCEYRYNNISNKKKIEKWQQHQGSLSKIVNYEINGVLVYSLLNIKKGHIRFFFQKINHENYRLIFSDFIGFINLEINLSKNGECFIHNTKKNCFSWDDFETMIEKLTSVNISFNNFQKWILGLPGDAFDFFLDNNGCIKNINYQSDNNNFIILYKNYFYNNVLILPNIIEICFNNEYYFNIKIYNWVIR